MKLTTLYMILLTTVGIAQVEKSSELHVTAKQMDSLLFSVGFNHCDLKTMNTLLADDFEFYHDLGGFQDKKAFMEATENNICLNKNGKVTRQLVEGSLETFPLKKNNELYGMLIRGEHEFYMQPIDEANRKTGYAKFSGYWELIQGAWILKRVFSFDHRAAE